MTKLFSIIFCVFFTFAFAQSTTEMGFAYGNSDIFRKTDQSHFNYQNSEFGFFFSKNLAWNKNDSQVLQKYWLIQPQVYIANYNFLSESVKQKIVRGIIYGGIKFQKPFQHWSLHSKLAVGAGYQSGYYQRLAKGIYFTEKLNVGISYPVFQQSNAGVDVGIMHVSNGNFYELNRGLEVFFIELSVEIH